MLTHIPASYIYANTHRLALNGPLLRNMAQIRQSRPDPRLGFQVKRGGTRDKKMSKGRPPRAVYHQVCNVYQDKRFQGVPFPLCSEVEYLEREDRVLDGPASGEKGSKGRSLARLYSGYRGPSLISNTTLPELYSRTTPRAL